MTNISFDKKGWRFSCIGYALFMVLWKIKNGILRDVNHEANLMKTFVNFHFKIIIYQNIVFGLQIK